MWPLPYHSRYDPYILWNVTCLSWIGCRCTWTRKKSSTNEFTEDVQCNARTPSLRLTVADARNSVVAEVEHAKLRQFPEPLDVGDLVLDKLHTRTHEMRETKKKTRKGRREGEDGFVPLLLLEEERLQT